jgi:AcrR family transcriptional regulator
MVTKAPARRPGGRSARVREAVLEATLDELVDHGYAAMTMQGIADRAGVNKSSLYRHWAGKGAVLADALVSKSAQVATPPDTGDIHTDLLVLWSTTPAPNVRRDFSRTVAVSRALAAASSDPDVRAAHRALWERRLELVQVIVQRAVKARQLPRGADPELLMDLLFGPFHTRVVARDKVPTRDFLAKVMDSALQAVGARAIAASGGRGR